MAPQLSHFYQTTPNDELYSELLSGVFLKNNKVKCWADKNKTKGFVLYAKTLSITLGDDKRHWKWTPEEERSGVYVEVAELIELDQLEVRGTFSTDYLTPMKRYKLAFLVKFTDQASGWEDVNTVTLKLELPNSTQILRKESFKNKPKNKWIEIPVAEFTVREDEEQGDMVFSMTEANYCFTKKGIVLKGIVIEPAK